MPDMEPISVQKKKKGLNWKAIAGLVVIFIMVGSGFILATSGDDDEELPENAFKVTGYNAKEYTFYETPEGDFGAYLLRQDGTLFPIVFRADPRNITEFHIDLEIPETIRSAEKVYLAYNPNQVNLSKVVVAAAQVSRIIPLTNGYMPVLAYTEDTEPIDKTIPIRNCDAASEENVVILFEVAGINDIVNENNCIHVRGENHDDLLLMADKLGMNVLGMEI